MIDNFTTIAHMGTLVALLEDAGVDEDEVERMRKLIKAIEDAVGDSNPTHREVIDQLYKIYNV